MALVSKELEALGRNGTTDGTASLATRLDELYLAVEVALQARLERDHREDDRLLSQPV